MNPEQLYRNLKELAERLNITVGEHNFRNTGIQVSSGVCKIKGKQFIIIDKNITLSQKNIVLASSLSKFHHEDLFVVPVVREFIEKHSDE